MKKIEISEKKNLNNLLINSFSENMFGDIITFDSHITSYGYSYIINLKYDDYKIITNLEAGGYCNINAEHQIGNVVSKINGKLGDGEIGIKTISDLTSGKVELNAYIKQNESAYDKIIEQYVQKKEKILRILCRRKKKKKTKTKTKPSSTSKPKPVPVPIPIDQKKPQYRYVYVWEVIKKETLKTVNKLKNIFKYY